MNRDNGFSTPRPLHPFLFATAAFKIGLSFAPRKLAETNRSEKMECSNASGIRRIFQDRTHWRVMVETWPERDGYHGRFVFAPERRVGPNDPRQGPAALRGNTREDVIAEAYNLPEDRLLRVFRSLG